MRPPDRKEKIEELRRREATGEHPVSLRQQEKLMIPRIHGAADRGQGDRLHRLEAVEAASKGESPA
jgi:hypothetical protein